MIGCRRGEELFKRICATDGPRPAVDLERSASTLTALFALFHGDAAPNAPNATPVVAWGRAGPAAVVAEADGKTPASAAGGGGFPPTCDMRLMLILSHSWPANTCLSYSWPVTQVQGRFLHWHEAVQFCIRAHIHWAGAEVRAPNAAPLPNTHCALMPPAVRSKVLQLLCRSVAAAQLFPATIMTIEDAVYGGRASAGGREFQGCHTFASLCLHSTQVACATRLLLATLQTSGF